MSSDDFRQLLLNDPPAAPYTGPVARRRRLALIGIAAFACLPGLLQARTSSDRTYTIHLPGSAAPAKIELSIAQPVADWEVSAVYDAARCEVHCTWRRKRDDSGPSSLLLPPTATVRIYANLASRPDTVTLDPAGSGLPGVTRELPLRRDAVFMPARRLFAMSKAQRVDDRAPAPQRVRFLSSTRQLDVTSASSLPLRI